MENQIKVTVKEIVKLNRGNWEDANEIIVRFLGTKELIPINNQSFNGYLSSTLKQKDLRLKTTYRYWVDQIKEGDTFISVIIKWGGWILLFLSQGLQINVWELLQDISGN